MSVNEKAAPSQAPIGVVFVHGVGSQKQSETLREFGQPLIDWLASWHEQNGVRGFRVERSDLSYGNDLSGPARLYLSVPKSLPGTPDAATEASPCDDPNARTWIFAEAWWATFLVGPDYIRMLRWSRRALGRTLGRLRAELAFRRKALLGQTPLNNLTKPEVAIEWLSTLLLSGLYFVGGIVGYVLLAILLPLAYIPVQQIREFVLVKVVRSFLVENIGDFSTFIDDDVQALNIRRSVEDAITWLADVEHCQEICVIAHSQGTVVAFDALCGMEQECNPHLTKVRKLITFGAALNNAFALAPTCARLQGTLPKHIFWLDVWAYFDPVPGGSMKRDRTNFRKPLVNPSAEVRQRFDWTEDGPKSHDVVNGMNVLTDHGGYWQNDEEFLSRLVAEIELPNAPSGGSRFEFADEAQRVRRRRTRITTLTFWRLCAMALFLAALAVRIAYGGMAQLESDGRVIVAMLAAIPGIQILGFPGQLVSWLGTVVHVLTQPLESQAAAGTLVGALRETVNPARLEPLAMVAVAALLFAAIFELAYLVLKHYVFTPWDERERLESRNRTLLPRRAGFGWRTTVVLVTLAIVAALIAKPVS